MAGESVDLVNLYVLLVEDEAFTRNLTQQMLRDLGIKRVVAAENGADAMKLVQHSASPFNVVVCDLRMPVMDGFAFVEGIRKGVQGCDPALPIIVMTGLADVETVERAADLGIDGYVVKPVSPAMMEARIRAALDADRLAKVSVARRVQAEIGRKDSKPAEAKPENEKAAS